MGPNVAGDAHFLCHLIRFAGSALQDTFAQLAEGTLFGCFIPIIRNILEPFLYGVLLALSAVSTLIQQVKYLISVIQHQLGSRLLKY